MKQFYLVCIISLSICALGVSGVVKTPQNTVIVPNVEGVALEVAVQMLQTAGLQPKYQTSGSLTALVVQQEPGPGFELPLGGEVSLSCEVTGKPSKTMPQTQSQPRTLAITSQPRTSVAPAKVSGVSIKNMATGISVVPIQITPTSSRSVVPIQTTATSSRNVVSSGRVPAGQATILYQPRQPAASKYMIAEPEPRFYPAWYPRQFITKATTQPQVSQPQSVNVITTAQPSVSLYAVPETELKTSLAWYPRPLLSQQERTQASKTESPEIQQLTVASVSPVIGQQRVPMPYLLRLSREDAILAIQKAGLSVGNLTSMASERERAGLVLKQSPQFRALVPLGTQVDLWITN